jgi:hypothetical protein
MTDIMSAALALAPCNNRTDGGGDSAAFSGSGASTRTCKAPPGTATNRPSGGNRASIERILKAVNAAIPISTPAKATQELTKFTVTL